MTAELNERRGAVATEEQTNVPEIETTLGEDVADAAEEMVDTPNQKENNE